MISSYLPNVPDSQEKKWISEYLEESSAITQINKSQKTCSEIVLSNSILSLLEDTRSHLVIVIKVIIKIDGLTDNETLTLDLQIIEHKTITNF